MRLVQRKLEVLLSKQLRLPEIAFSVISAFYQQSPFYLILRSDCSDSMESRVREANLCGHHQNILS